MNADSAIKGTRNKVHSFKWFITIILPLVIYCIPTNGAFDQTIRLFLVITLFAILIIAFELFDYMIPAILLPTAYVLFGIATSDVVLKSWAGTMPFLIIGSFLLAAVLSEVNLMKRVAFWFIKKMGGTYNGLLYGLTLVAMIITFLASGKGYIIVAALCAGICKSLDLEKGRESGTIMLVGIATAGFATTGLVYAPQFMGMLIQGMQSVVPGVEIAYLQFMFHQLPWLGFMFLFTFIVTKVYPSSQIISGKEYFASEYQKLGKMSLAEKKAAVVTIAMIIFLSTTKYHGYPLEYGFILFPWLFFMPGINIGTKSSIKSINFEILFFMMACISIGSVSSAIGFGKIVSDLLVPVLAPFSPTIIVVLVWFCGIILNMLMTPLAVIGAFSAPITQLAVDLNLNPLGVVYALLNSMDLVVMPYESTPYLIAFSFGYISMSHFIKFSLLKLTIATCFLMVIIIPYWNLIGVL